MFISLFNSFFKITVFIHFVHLLTPAAQFFSVPRIKVGCQLLLVLNKQLQKTLVQYAFR